MLKLNAKFDADSLLCHFECDGHTVHMLIQQHLLPPLTNIVKSSLFTHAHSSPFSLAARLYQCRANCSCYINNGWTFSGTTLCKVREMLSEKNRVRGEKERPLPSSVLSTIFTSWEPGGGTFKRPWKGVRWDRDTS